MTMTACGARTQVIVNDTTNPSKALPAINDTTDLSEGLLAINDIIDLSKRLLVINDTSIKITCMVDNLCGCSLNQCLNNLCG